MFDKSKENIFVAKERDTTEDMKVLLFSENKDSEGCLYPSDVRSTLEATFRFIKNNPLIQNGKIVEGIITIKQFLKSDLTSPESEYNYSTTSIQGSVKEVYYNYVVLCFRNSKGQIFESNIVYNDIVSIRFRAIEENLEDYINYINCNTPPLCRIKKSESLDLLIKLATILGRNNPNERDLIFILDRVLTRKFKVEYVGILRNLIILEDLFILPITSIQGFLQTGVCNK